MSLHLIGPGDNVPSEMNVVVEIPAYSNPVKYEVDKDTGALLVDRFMATAMHYPCNYGYVPRTLSEDGDPVDVLAVTPFPLLSGSVMKCRPVGLLNMKDEAGPDVKVLAVPTNKLSTVYDHVHSPEDLKEDLKSSIRHFFEHYKDLEPGKWVEVSGWESREKAAQEIENALQRYQA